MKKVWILFLVLILISIRPAMGGAAAPVGEEINPSSLHCGVCEGAEAQNFGKVPPEKLVAGLSMLSSGGPICLPSRFMPENQAEMF